MFIDKQSPIPVYYQIKSYILKQIESKEWGIDQPLPSERMLSEMAKVSRMTIRQAINELVNDGIVYRLKGKGTFITQGRIEQKNITSFSEMVKSKGIIPNTEILVFEKDYSSKDIALSLNVSPSTTLYHIKRLRKAGNAPVGIEEVFIPTVYCDGIENFDLTGSLYKILLEEYQHKIEKVNVNIEAILSNNKDIEKLLEIEKPFPLLKVSGNSITNTGLNLFHEISFYRSDQLSYKVSIFNRKDY